MGLYLPIPMDYLIMLFPNDWDISRGTHLDGCYWLLFATSTTTSPLHQHKCWLGEITPKITYGYGSIPINTILVGWTSIYQLFWCSPGVQGFDTLPYVGTKTATGLDFLCNFLKQAALPLRLLRRRQICGISIHNTMDFWVWTWGSSWPRSWGIFRQSWMTTLLYLSIYIYIHICIYANM
jgi:hypothetical protein